MSRKDDLIIENSFLVNNDKNVNIIGHVNRKDIIKELKENSRKPTEEEIRKQSNKIILKNIPDKDRKILKKLQKEMDDFEMNGF